MADLGCQFAGPDGTGIPDITDTHVHFNGVRHCGHTEPRVFVAALTIAAPLIREAHPEGAVYHPRSTGTVDAGGELRRKQYHSKESGDGWCKTFKPYDVAVTALLITKRYWG